LAIGSIIPEEKRKNIFLQNYYVFLQFYYGGLLGGAIAGVIKRAVGIITAE